MADRVSPLEAAERFIDNTFPKCSVAILAGSASQGLETADSDLDLVLFDETCSYPFRRTYTSSGWTIEAFVVTRDSFEIFVEAAAETGLPSLLRMCVEGMILKDDGLAAELIDIAKEALKAGPYEWTQQRIDDARYEISSGILDLQSSKDRPERLFITAKLTGLVHEFVLRTKRQWIGDGKWALRTFKRFDGELCDSLIGAMEQLYREDEHEPLVCFIHGILEPYGGLLTEGYSEGEMDL